MISGSVLRLILALLLLSPIAFAAQMPNAPTDATIHYTVSLADPTRHLLQIKIQIPPGAARHDLQLPVWNATYQVRDFSHFVNWIRAQSPSGSPLPITLADKSRWQVRGTAEGAEVDYEIVANEAGPYGAEFNSHHAFFNLAEILMYPVDARAAVMKVSYTSVPDGWRSATSLPGTISSGFTAENYDRLVDSPIELGTFEESDFDQNGGHYRIIVDADPADYDLPKIEATAEQIVTTETKWMNDRPFGTFLFLYHFPHDGGGGGMEHAFSTAITLHAQSVRANPGLIADVTAHEFFHLWNVKRIRPQSLEPVDYTRENYTRALWFSEGVTSTVENYTLVQTALISEAQFLTRLSWTITDLERRPAHLTQSVEESSLDAWLEKYPYYGTPDRSISYYNKGELLGTILDLQLREVTHGTKSLRDLFQWMNQNYAKQGRYFPDSDGVREAAEALSGTDFKPFFEKYVSGTEEIPWDEFFATVGLHLARVTTQVGDPGFSATRNFNQAPVVTEVVPNSEAAHAGLSPGDSVIEVNGRLAGGDLERMFAQLIPGLVLHLKIRNRQGEHKLQWKLAGQDRTDFQLKDIDDITPQQKTRRTAWLKGESETSGAALP